MKIIKLAVIASALMATSAIAAPSAIYGCETVSVMSKVTPGKVLYMNYADPTCPIQSRGVERTDIFDVITGDFLYTRIDDK